MEVWQTSNLQPLRLGEERKKERRTNGRMKIYMVCPITQGDHKKVAPRLHSKLDFELDRASNIVEDEGLQGWVHIGLPLH